MKGFSFQEFRPTILFLIKFICFYIIGNVFYGLYVSSYYPKPDPVTNLVSQHSGLIISRAGGNVQVKDHDQKPNTLIIYQDNPILLVYEGCNGLNTMIIFIAFLISFGPLSLKLLWFTLMGILVLHIANLCRIVLLFFVALYWQDYMYFIHKYFFTAALYAVTFILWVLWIKKYALRK